MELNEIKLVIDDAKWFSALGSFLASDGQLALADLHAWDKQLLNSSDGDESATIASEMTWLPSSRDEEDPIHGQLLLNFLDEAGINYKASSVEFYKYALHSLRKVADTAICSGPNNFTQAAIGAALYCVRDVCSRIDGS